MNKGTFSLRKLQFHAIPWLFGFPTIFICKKWAKYNFTATAKLRQTRFSYLNTPKHTQNWLFWGIFSFFCCWGLFFEKFESIICFFYASSVWWNIPNDWYIPQVYENGTFKFHQKRNCPPSNAMVEPAYGRAWAIEHSLKRWQHQYPIVNPSVHPSTPSSLKGGGGGHYTLEGGQCCFRWNLKVLLFFIYGTDPLRVILTISLLVNPSIHLFPYQNNFLKLFLCSFLCPVTNELVLTWQVDNSCNDRSWIAL